MPASHTNVGAGNACSGKSMTIRFGLPTTDKITFSVDLGSSIDNHNQVIKI